MANDSPLAGAQPAAPQDAATEPTFQIEKVYAKDLSVEVPHAPQVFMQPASPQLEVQVSNQSTQFGDTLYEVVVTVTVTARVEEKTVFLVEVAQAGIFNVRGVSAEEMEPLLAVACPTIIYPYAREVVSDLVTRAGFPPVVLQPVSFEQMFLHHKQQQAEGAPRAETVN